MNKSENQEFFGFQDARRTLSWAGVGLMPHGEVTRRALDSVSAMGLLEQSEKIKSVLESLYRGVLPKQRDCQDAVSDLETLYERAESADHSVEAPRG